MWTNVIEGIAIPFAGTALGSACVFFMKKELIPEMSAGEHSNTGVLMFAFGFTLMMALDVALG